MNSRHYLIIFSQRVEIGEIKDMQGIITVNKRTLNCPVKDMTPITWLIAMKKKFPDRDITLLNALEISKEEFDELNELVNTINKVTHMN